MTTPSMTYTFTNGTTADATQVNTNFQDVIDWMTDGTGDFSINALTCAGAATFNGAVSLGNGTIDDIAVNGYITTSLLPKTKGTPTVGSTTVWWGGAYIGNGTYYVGILPADTPTGSYVVKMPPAVEVKGQGLVSGGSGAMAWAPLHYDTYSFNDTYAILDNDGYRHINLTTGAAGKTVTLPTASANTDRLVTITKVDTGAGALTVAGEAAEFVGAILYRQYESITVACDGTTWWPIGDYRIPTSEIIMTSTMSRGGSSSGEDSVVSFATNSVTGSDITFTARDATHGDKFTINRSGVYAVQFCCRTSSASWIWVSKNDDAGDLTSTDVSTVATAHLIATGYNSTVLIPSCVGTVRLAAGDIIRCHSEIAVNTGAGGFPYAKFILTQVAIL